MMVFLSCARNHKFNRKKVFVEEGNNLDGRGRTGQERPSGCWSMRSFKHATQSS